MEKRDWEFWIVGLALDHLGKLAGGLQVNPDLIVPIVSDCHYTVVVVGWLSY